MQTSRFHWHWSQTNWTRHFYPRNFNGVKIGTALKCIFIEIVPKLSVNFGNRNSQDSHKNQYPSSALNFGFTEPQYSYKCWLNLPLKCHIFTTDDTYWVSSILSWFASLNHKAFGNLCCNSQKSFHTSPEPYDSNNRGYRSLFKLNNGIYKKNYV